jgi:hypothetical protein
MQIMDDKENIVVLEWRFSPPDYFEEPIQIKRDDYVMTISSGTVEARIKPEIYDKDQSMRDKLHSSLNDRFLGVQLFSHKPYELSKASMYRLHPDGRKDITIFPESLVLTMSMGEPDIIVKDKDGNVISDSKHERIQKKQKLAELAEKYRQKDPVVASVLRSYNGAVKDPDNELVHLYDIRDAIKKKFGGESAARSALGIIRKQWSRLGELADDMPIKQGRHRGKHPGVLRDATEGELKEARSIARNLVEVYLDYLERV